MSEDEFKKILYLLSIEYHIDVEVSQYFESRFGNSKNETILKHKFKYGTTNIYNLKMLTLFFEPKELVNSKWIIYSKNCHMIETLNYLHEKEYGGNIKNMTQVFDKISSCKIPLGFEEKNINKITFENVEGKYDFSFIDLFNRKDNYDEFDIVEYQLNSSLHNNNYFIKRLESLVKVLNIGGTLFINISGITNYFITDMLSLLTEIFEEVYLYLSEFSNKTILATRIICKNYNGNKFNFKEVKLKLKENKSITTKINNIKIKKANNLSFIKNYNDNFIDKIKEINDYKLKEWSQFLDEIEYVYDSKKDIKLIQKEQVLNAIKIAKSLDLKIKDEYKGDLYKEKTLMSILNNLYSYEETAQHKIKSNFNAKIIEPKTNENTWIKPLIVKHFNIQNEYENVNLENYDKIQRLTRYYVGSLNKKVGNLTNSFVGYRSPSRAWLKMYEILETFDIIPNKETINSLHGCEAPGNFILAINHFIKTRTNVKNFNWIGQTYSPDEKIVGDDDALGDTYGLIKKYSDKWDYGVTKTGDITKPENLTYYKEKYPNLDLVTLDCGVDWRDKNLDDYDTFLLFCQLLFVLRTCGKHGNGVIKIRIESLGYASIMSIVVLLCSRFKYVYYYKPFPNPWSSEFYMVMKDYQDVLTDEEFKIIEDFVNNFDKNKEITDLTKVPDELKAQIYGATKKIVDRHIFFIKRGIYYVNNYDEIEREHYDKIKLRVNEKNEEWIARFNVKYIEDDMKL